MDGSALIAALHDKGPNVAEFSGPSDSLERMTYLYFSQRLDRATVDSREIALVGRKRYR